MPSKSFFSSSIYQTKLIKSDSALCNQIKKEFFDIMQLDGGGRVWSKKNYRNGFTSYASANQLHKYYSAFQKLETAINHHVWGFANTLNFSGARRLKMNTCWINFMPANTHHGMHIHPLSVISGTFYLELPPGSSPLRIEDPRMPLFMARPALKPKSSQLVVDLPAKNGDIILFESWLRHEVPLNSSKKPRLSISFNYD